MSTSSPTTESESEQRPWWVRVGGALTHRNYRLLWCAALGSTIGTWMQNYAQDLLVYQLTKSKFYLGLDDFLGQLPILLFMLIGWAESQFPPLKAVRDIKLTLILFFVLVILGVGISVYSTHRSVLKYLRMKLDDLY